jgi:AraC-like DNA-binding protein
MDAIFDLTGGLAPLGAPHEAKAAPAAFVTGATVEPAVIKLPASPHVAGIRFKPGGASAFMNINANDIAEFSIPLDDLMPRFAHSATVAAGEARSPAVMARALDRLLLERMHRARRPDALSAHAVSALGPLNPALRIDTLARVMGVTHKRLERNVKRHTGLTPKQMGRTLRFIHAVRLLNAGRSGSLADLALLLGFTDQAHFNREFKAMAGLSPTNWLRERRNVDFLQYTPLSLA